ncbi:DUF3598 family protein [Trichormus variabilis]|uniref:Uncharacterized protein n=1 Tax=Trichormus variabilis SAG 1403-4b TaxID=447716 RepID=A0A433UQJ9_ANAVA|nr:DUF3598 family protein [Trichormus variabilis]MBD2626337.1 DUF3598 family protein [Trichormus variabilis FACHB-164]RUS96125.1 hypothetical protein DSM107003_27870 [Trichormus variabilis SAG 1403-4b]
MTKQWECLLQNLGEWQGSFTRYSPQGTLLEDIKSVVSLEGLNDNQTVRQTIRQGNTEQVLEYSSLARSVLFFENGAFSQGSMQLGPFSEFGAELGLIHENRRLRLVELFDKNGKIESLTLIREHLAGTEAVENPPLQVDDLLGEWLGEAVTIYPDWRSPTTFSTTLKLQIDATEKLIQNTHFGEHNITSTATIKDSIILFDQNPQKQVQVLLLPNGASATFPLQVQLRQSLFLEVGWLITPTLRKRLIRNYDDKGAWISLTLVTENRVK